MQHGLVDSSDTFIVNDPDKAPAFIMARNGYDVWLGNSRGNKYSKKHVSLNPAKDPAYWKFSWQEMSEFDLPACIDFVLQHTGK
jgi:hypothetical protein|mmetsp:Transcript_34472/g.6214  ORF Transcript_34472/g.6214 Transcript_34472/m.6214 type:complete len:84 (-) Transcript_34472:99-350(-)